MLNKPTSLEADTTPTQGVIFCPERAELNGLSYAQMQQLTLDYLADPEAFGEVVRFRGKHIDEIEAFQTALGAFGTARTDHHDRDLSYKRLSEWGTHPDEIIGVALKAAGMAVWHSKEELKKESAVLGEAGEAFSRTMARYFSSRLSPQAEIRINGTTYGFWHGVLTKTVTEDKHQRVTLFAQAGDIVAVFMRDNYRGVNEAANTVKKDGQFCRTPQPEEWQQLLDGLNLTAKL